jgi:hypothetical protein
MSCIEKQQGTDFHERGVGSHVKVTHLIALRFVSDFARSPDFFGTELNNEREFARSAPHHLAFLCSSHLCFRLFPVAEIAFEGWLFRLHGDLLTIITQAEALPSKTRSANVVLIRVILHVLNSGLKVYQKNLNAGLLDLQT